MALICSALPYPPQTRRKLDALSSNSASRADVIEKLKAGRDALRYQLDLIESDLSALSSLTEPSSQADAIQPGETKESTLAEKVSKLRPRVGQLGWNDNLADSFQAIGDSPGNVSGNSWTNGFLLSPELFLTTAHSLAGSGNGWQWPTRRGRGLSPTELAELFNVRFSDELPNSNESKLSTGNSTTADTGTFIKLVTGITRFHKTEGELILLRLLQEPGREEEPLEELPPNSNYSANENDQLYLLPFAKADSAQPISLINSPTLQATDTYSIKERYMSFEINHSEKDTPQPGQRKWLSGTPIVNESGTLVAMYLAQEFSTNINYAIRVPENLNADKNLAENGSKIAEDA